MPLLPFSHAGLHFLVLLASILTALLEIQIEGQHGFAKKLPTWRLDFAWYKMVTNGKELTGYHLYLNLLLLLFFHFVFLGTGWSMQKELVIMAAFFLYIPCWDFLWFVFNPAFGWRNFEKKNIWWFPNWYGPFPADYYDCTTISFILAFVSPLFAAHPTGITPVEALLESIQFLSGWIFSASILLLLPILVFTYIIQRRQKAVPKMTSWVCNVINCERIPLMKKQ